MTLPTGSSSEDFCRSFYQFQCRVEVTSTFLLSFFSKWLLENYAGEESKGCQWPVLCIAVGDVGTCSSPLKHPNTWAV